MEGEHGAMGNRTLGRVKRAQLSSPPDAKHSAVRALLRCVYISLVYPRPRFPAYYMIASGTPEMDNVPRRVPWLRVHGVFLIDMLVRLPPSRGRAAPADSSRSVKSLRKPYPAY